MTHITVKQLLAARCRACNDPAALPDYRRLYKTWQRQRTAAGKSPLPPWR